MMLTVKELLVQINQNHAHFYPQTIAPRNFFTVLKILLT